MSSTIFSVVDIETTGTSQSNDNRIIQFSCTFVKNKNIIGSFNSFINPEMDIPSDIIKLTGITNELVKNAPTFNEFASKISSLLKDTVFVAHNVDFDFPFINKELDRVGQKMIDNMAIDTVTLSQLLLPTEKSYRLIDLSQNLNILHQHPHSSSSDAFATAKLLIILFNQIEKIPKKTIKQLISINPTLPKNTIDIFKYAYKNNVDMFNDKLLDINRLKIRKIQYKERLKIRKINYPESKGKQKNIFNGVYKWNSEESKLMNSIYDNYKNSDNSKNLLVEQNNELDYDLGFLFPLVHLLNNENKIVVAVHKHSIHEDLSKTINRINKITKNNFKKLVLHSIDDYIDLNKFRDALNIKSNSKQTEFLKCKILIWLTFTKTGDLHELNLDMKNDQNVFLKTIGNTNNKGYYMNKLKNDFNNSNVVVISHEYLYNNRHMLAKYKPYLVIKDAVDFNKQILKHYRVNFKINQNNILIRHAQYLLYQTHNKNLYDIFKDDKSNIKLVQNIDSLIKEYENYALKLQKSFEESFINKRNFITLKKGFKNPINNIELVNFIKHNKEYIDKQSSLIKQIRSLSKKIIKSNGTLKSSEKAIITTFNDRIFNLNKFFNNNILLIKNLVYMDKKVTFQNYLNVDKNADNSTLVGGLIKNDDLLKNKIYTLFFNILFMDTAIYSSDKSEFILNKLELDNNNTSMIKSSYQTNLNNDYKIFYNNNKQEIDLNTLDLENNNTFIMANTQEKIDEIYENIKQNRNDSLLVLCQKINGNKDKIIKKFTNSKGATIIGNYDLFMSIKNINKSINRLIVQSINSSDMYNENSNLTDLYNLMIKNSIKHIIQLSNNKGVILINDFSLINENSIKSLKNMISNHIKMFKIDSKNEIRTFNNF